MREAGKLDDALLEIKKAVEIDPSSAIARQEVVRTQQMIRLPRHRPQATVRPSR